MKKLSNIKIAISQVGIDFCERRMLVAQERQRIKTEIFWGKLSYHFLRRF